MDAKIEFYAKKHVYRLILSSVGLKIADFGPGPLESTLKWGDIP